jgi:hypothetical protein
MVIFCLIESESMSFDFINASDRFDLQCPFFKVPFHEKGFANIPAH